MPKSWGEPGWARAVVPVQNVRVDVGVYQAGRHRQMHQIEHFRAGVRPQIFPHSLDSVSIYQNIHLFLDIPVNPVIQLSAPQQLLLHCFQHPFQIS